MSTNPETMLKAQEALEALRDANRKFQALFEDPDLIKKGIKFRGYFNTTPEEKKLIVKCFFDMELPAFLFKEMETYIPPCPDCGGTDLRNIDAPGGTVQVCNDCYLKTLKKMSDDIAV